MNIESFCKTVWGLSYDEVQAKSTKKEYSEFYIPKKSGKRQITYLSHDSSLFSLQEKLNQICMLSPYIQVQNQIQPLNAMQEQNNFKSISSFTHPELLREIQAISLSIAKGNKEEINKTKNLLI